MVKLSGLVKRRTNRLLKTLKQFGKELGIEEKDLEKLEISLKQEIENLERLENEIGRETGKLLKILLEYEVTKKELATKIVNVIHILAGVQGKIHNLRVRVANVGTRIKTLIKKGIGKSALLALKAAGWAGSPTARQTAEAAEEEIEETIMLERQSASAIRSLNRILYEVNASIEGTLQRLKEINNKEKKLLDQIKNNLNKEEEIINKALHIEATLKNLESQLSQVLSELQRTSS